MRPASPLLPCAAADRRHLVRQQRQRDGAAGLLRDQGSAQYHGRLLRDGELGWADVFLWMQALCWRSLAVWSMQITNVGRWVRQPQHATTHVPVSTPRPCRPPPPPHLSAAAGGGQRGGTFSFPCPRGACPCPLSRALPGGPCPLPLPGAFPLPRPAGGATSDPGPAHSARHNCARRHPAALWHPCSGARSGGGPSGRPCCAAAGVITCQPGTWPHDSAAYPSRMPQHPSSFQPTHSLYRQASMLHSAR